MLALYAGYDKILGYLHGCPYVLLDFPELLHDFVWQAPAQQLSRNPDVDLVPLNERARSDSGKRMDGWMDRYPTS